METIKDFLRSIDSSDLNWLRRVKCRTLHWKIKEVENARWLKGCFAIYVSHTFPYLPLSNYHVTLQEPHNLQTSLNNSLDSAALFWICSSIFSEEPLSTIFQSQLRLWVLNISKVQWHTVWNLTVELIICLLEKLLQKTISMVSVKNKQ